MVIFYYLSQVDNRIFILIKYGVGKMKIVKVINGEKHEFNIITKHNDLQERDSYGCHPISAIRNLPEKISALKEKDADLQNQITELKKAEMIDTTARNNATEAKQSIGNIETNVKNINLSETNGELKFTNYEGKSATFRSGNEVDNSTIELVNNKISLKKVFTTEDLNGDGTETNPLNLVNKPDEYTLVTRDNKLEVVGLRSASGLVTAEYISDITLDLQEQITKNEDTIEDINDAVVTQEDRLHKLEILTQGFGGYLNSYDFGLNPTQEELTQYAMTVIGIENRNEIFNGTKVINTFNKHVWVLTNTPNSSPAIFNWSDLGQVEDIAIATNDTLGLIKSSSNQYEGLVDSLGHITINGLEEKLNDLISRDELNEVKDICIKRLVYNNTTFSKHLTELLNYIVNNTSLNCIKFKLSENLMGDVIQFTTNSIDGNTNVTNLNNQVILNTSSLYFAYLKQFITSETGYQLYFSVGDKGNSITLCITYDIEKEPSVTILGNIDTISNEIIKHIYKDISLIDIPLEQLVIEYYM
jgi:hypothetical protein